MLTQVAEELSVSRVAIGVQHTRLGFGRCEMNFRVPVAES
jgi:hypothetical protein